MGKLGSAFYILGAIFWVLSIPATGLIGVLFAGICILLAAT